MISRFIAAGHRISYLQGMFGLGTWELLIILMVVTLLFGATRLPGLGKGLGEGMRSFRDAFKGEPDQDGKELDSSDPKNGDA